jgi:hypothetical protein
MQCVRKVRNLIPVWDSYARLAQSLHGEFPLSIPVPISWPNSCMRKWSDQLWHEWCKATYEPTTEHPFSFHLARGLHPYSATGILHVGKSYVARRDMAQCGKSADRDRLAHPRRSASL